MFILEKRFPSQFSKVIRNRNVGEKVAEISKCQGNGLKPV